MRDWPPAPGRGRYYSAAERERLLQLDVPELSKLRAHADEWHARIGATVDVGWILDEWNLPGSPSPWVRARALRHELARELVTAWPPRFRATREWLDEWVRTRLAPRVRELRRQMDTLDNPAWLRPGNGAAATRALAPFGATAQARFRERYHRSDVISPPTGTTAELHRGWALVSRLPTTESELVRALPAGSTMAHLPATAGVQVRLVMGGRAYTGPVGRGKAEALAGLVALGRDIAAAAPVPDLAAWDAHVARARRRLSPGARANPSAAPAVDRLGALAQGAGLPALAGWLAANSPDAGAIVFEAAAWSAVHPTGWRTEVRRAADYTRADLGTVDPRELVSLRGRGAGADGIPPGFERWHEREGERRAGRWAGTAGAHTPAAWKALVEAERTERDPITVVRTARGAVEVIEPDRARAAVEAGVSSVLVRVLYEAGSEVHGLVTRPGAGALEPFPPGRRVDAPGGPGTVASIAYAGGFVPEDAVEVELDAGGRELAPARALTLRPEPPARVRPATRANVGLPAAAVAHGFPRLAAWFIATPVPRVNPAHGRVRVNAGGGELLVRAADARSRVLERASAVELRDAALHPTWVEGTYQRRLPGRPPPAAGRWRTVAGVPGLWTAVEDTGAPGHVIVFAGVRAAARERLAAEPLRANRGVALDALGEGLYDSEGRRYQVVYQVVEAALDASTVATSHLPSDLSQWTPGYPREFQTRDLGSLEESAKIRAIARGLDPERLLGRNMDATLGPPVAWEGEDGRLYVLGGNGRALAILIADDEHYRRYERAGRAAWSCWPAHAPRDGFRWMLLRVVEGASRTQAAQLAAASQASTAAEEGRLGRALGLVRSLRLGADLPPVRWLEPITAANVTEFTRGNMAFVEAVLAGMDPAKRASYMNDADKLGPLLESVLLGLLPAELQRGGLLSDPKLEDALLGALPGLASLRGAVRGMEVYPAFDLLSELPRAVGVFEYLRGRRMSFRAFEAELEAELRTSRLGEIERLSDTSDLALALAAALYNASRRAAPAVVMSGFVAEYYAEAIKHNPRQAGLWGGSHPDPAQVLAGVVGTFHLPRRQNPRPRVPSNVSLLFDRAHFPTPSDARGWMKNAGVHAGIPREWGPWWRVGDVEAGRQVPVGPGVLALVVA